MAYQAVNRHSVMAGVGQFARREIRAHQPMNPQILGLLGRAMSLEWSASQQYLAHAAMCQKRSENDFAEQFVTLANEEFRHAAELTERMVDYGALPSGSVLTPSKPSFDIIEALSICELHEVHLINLYEQAYHLSANLNLAADAELFGRLYEEESDQLMRIRQWSADYVAQARVHQTMTRGFL
jgi:bacterioferritin